MFHRSVVLLHYLSVRIYFVYEIDTNKRTYEHTHHQTFFIPHRYHHFSSFYTKDVFFSSCLFQENFPDSVFYILFIFKHDFLHTFLVIWKMSRLARKSSIFNSVFGRKWIFVDIMRDSCHMICIIRSIIMLGWVICMMGFLTKDAKYVKKQMLLGSWQWVMTQSCDKICRTYFMEMIFKKRNLGNDKIFSFEKFNAYPIINYD